MTPAFPPVGRAYEPDDVQRTAYWQIAVSEETDPAAGSAWPEPAGRPPMERGGAAGAKVRVPT
jgi:hypothetical protein